MTLLLGHASKAAINLRDIAVNSNASSLYPLLKDASTIVEHYRVDQGVYATAIYCKKAFLRPLISKTVLDL